MEDRKPISIVTNEDCLSMMRRMDKECIDLTITSPPYNLGNNHHTGNKRVYSYDDDKPEQEYQDEQIEVLMELFRITKIGG